jgi:hypothetical protein
MLSVIQKITGLHCEGLNHINKNIHIYKSEYDKTKYYFKKCMNQINIANKITFNTVLHKNKNLYDEYQFFRLYFNYLKITYNIFYDEARWKYKNDDESSHPYEFHMIHSDDSIRHQLINMKNPQSVITNNFYNNHIHPYDVKQYNTRFIRNIIYVTLLPDNRMQRWINISHDLLLNYLNEQVLCKTITKNDREWCREIYEDLLLHKDLQDLLTEKIKMSKLFS